MQTALILMEASSAHVTLDTLVMEIIVQVSEHRHCYLFQRCRFFNNPACPWMLGYKVVLRYSVLQMWMNVQVGSMDVIKMQTAPTLLAVTSAHVSMDMVAQDSLVVRN